MKKKNQLKLQENIIKRKMNRLCKSLIFKNGGKIIFNEINKERKKENAMLWTSIGLLLLFWVLGLVFNVVGGIIHVLLVLAVIVFLYNFFVKRRKTRV